MANGRPGDNPLSDLMLHGQHPFPADIEAMLRRLYALDPKLLRQFDGVVFDWERGQGLAEGRQALRALLTLHGIDPDRLGPATPRRP